MIEIIGDNSKIIKDEVITVLEVCDIVVVGGGLAGVSAAISAAEEGLKTVLVEKQTFVGGMFYSGLSDWESPVLDQLLPDGLRGEREETGQQLLELLIEKKVSLYLHTMAVELWQEKGELRGIFLATKQGMMSIGAKTLIDATDNRKLLEKAGIEGITNQIKARTVFGLGRINSLKAANYFKEKGIPHSLIWKEEGHDRERGELCFDMNCKTLLPDGKIKIVFYGKNHISQIMGLSEEIVLRSEKEESSVYVSLNKASVDLAELLKKNIPGFENTFLDWTAPAVGFSGGYVPKCESQNGHFQKEGLSGLISVVFCNKTGNKMVELRTPEQAYMRGREAGQTAVSICRKKRKSKYEDVRRTCEISTEKECDVIVVGGGASGITAAVAAARKGMRTILAERNSLLGGDMLAGGLSWLSFYNLYREFGVKEKQLVFGIGYEIVKRLEELNGCPGFYEDVAPYTQESKGTHGDREYMKYLFYQLMEENNVELLLNTMLTDSVVREESYILGNCIEGVVVQDVNSRYVIKAKVVIDASGDGDAAFYAGANCREYKTHGVGMAFGVTNVNFKKALNYAKQKKAVAHEAYGSIGEMKGELVKYSLRTYFVPELYDSVKSSGIHNSFCIESCHKGEASYINGVTTPNSNILQPRKATDTIIDLRRRMFCSADFLRNYIPGFEECSLNWCTQIPGARQTRYVECYYNISEKDIENGVIPKDSIGLFGGHDGHYAGYKINNGGWYGIPYRALIPRFVKNMLVAGRMLSSDWAAYMSTRLNVSCFIQGQAAGTAAQLAIRQGCDVSEIPIEQLQEELRRDSVFLEGCR